MSEKHELVKVILVRIIFYPTQETDGAQIRRVRAEQREQTQNDKQHDTQAWSHRAHILFAHRRIGIARTRDRASGHSLTIIMLLRTLARKTSGANCWFSGVNCFTDSKRLPIMNPWAVILNGTGSNFGCTSPAELSLAPCSGSGHGVAPVTRFQRLSGQE